MDAGEGQEEHPIAPLPLSSIHTRLPIAGASARDRALAQQMWLSVASFMAGSGYTAKQAEDVAHEVERRMVIMQCTYGGALDSVWHDLKAGRTIIG